MAKRYRHRDTVVPAIQWRGDNRPEIDAFCQAARIWSVSNGQLELAIRTREEHVARMVNLRDWIVQGVLGEFYVVRGDAFGLLYEDVEAT